MKFGEIDITAFELDSISHDDIPSILRGLQHIYTTPELPSVVFKFLERVIPTRSDTGVSDDQRQQKPIATLASQDGAVEDFVSRCVVLLPCLNTD